MANRPLRIHNKSSKPDNIVLKENQIIQQCTQIESELPGFMYDFFLYLKSAVSINTRLAYLSDIHFFCRYLVFEAKMFPVANIGQLTVENFNTIRAKDINRYLGEFCSRYIISGQSYDYIMENHNRSLSRKKSSLSGLFKYLYRDELIDKNITDGFNPIKLPKPQPDAIKKLEIDEVAVMLDAVDRGEGLTEKERQYWEKTKLRDKAILLLFTTFGLRLSELQQLNLSSFNFHRGEFMIYRKRGKETNMPLNQSTVQAVNQYVELERPLLLDKATDEDALFLSLQGSRITVRAIRQLVKKYTSIPLGTSRDEGYSPHKLRATAASSLIEYGFSIYDVQNLLDHDNVTTTQLYAAHKKNVKRDIVKNYELIDEFDTHQKKSDK